MSGDEWFDVVNARDEVIRRATRREVHATGLWHRAVHVLVFDAAGRVFLQKRSMKKDLSPGLWDSSCSGHLDAGEDYDAAAVRELSEELGVRVSPPLARWFRVEACEENRLGIRVGLRAPARRAVYVASRRNRNWRMDCAGGSDTADRGAPRKLCAVFPADLDAGGGEEFSEVGVGQGQFFLWVGCPHPASACGLR